jgi:hypothetical protein
MTAMAKSVDIEAPEINVSGDEMSIVIKATLTNDLRDCAFSRAEVAQSLSKLAGRAITEAMLDAFTAESKVGHRFPAELIAPWVRVTGSERLLLLFCQWTGFCLSNEMEQQFAELGRAQIQKEKAEARVAALKGELWRAVR